MPINPTLLASSLTGMLLASPGAFALPSPPTVIQGAYAIGSAGAAAAHPARQAASKTDAAGTPPAWRAQLGANAQGLAALRAGWDGPGSIPISPETLARAVFYVDSALRDCSNDMIPPRLVPGGDGSVQIEWHTRHGELELDIDDQGRASIWIRNHLSHAEFDGEDETALALFYRWAPWVAAPERHAVDVLAAPQMAYLSFAA
jgi:hypothetical protein